MLKETEVEDENTAKKAFKLWQQNCTPELRPYLSRLLPVPVNIM